MFNMSAMVRCPVPCQTPFKFRARTINVQQFHRELQIAVEYLPQVSLGSHAVVFTHQYRAAGLECSYVLSIHTCICFSGHHGADKSLTNARCTIILYSKEKNVFELVVFPRSKNVHMQTTTVNIFPDQS